MSELTANDIDVYFGSFTCDPGTSMCVNMHRIEYKKVDNLPWEINTVQCENLSAENFLQNNDLNITASCFHVDFSSDNLFSIHASPCFWEFVFKKMAEKVIKPVNMRNQGGYGATTCVRMAYKAYQMRDFQFSFEKIDPAGSIAATQKKKWDEMIDWENNPFHEYQCKKSRNHFVIVKKHKKIICVTCPAGRANAKCAHKMCKKCCVSYVTSNENIVKCKEKSHHTITGSGGSNER